MKTLGTIFLVLLLALAGLNSVALAQNRNFQAHLSGSEEVPPVDTRAQGQAIFRLGEDGQSLHFKLIVANIENLAQAHIHFGAAGENGPIVAWLFPAGPPPTLVPGRSNGVLAQGAITESSLVGPLDGEPFSSLVELIELGLAYVNVHTEQHPPGEARGQIR